MKNGYPTLTSGTASDSRPVAIWPDGGHEARPELRRAFLSEEGPAPYAAKSSFILSAMALGLVGLFNEDRAHRKVVASHLNIARSNNDFNGRPSPPNIVCER